MSVDLPSSTEPQVLKRRISIGGWEWGMERLKVSGLLPVFHRSFAGLVVRARAAFGDTRGCDLGNDIVDRVSLRFDHTGADHVGDGADPNHQTRGFVGRFGPRAVIG